jgi:hypothetical protein
VSDVRRFGCCLADVLLGDNELFVGIRIELGKVDRSPEQRVTDLQVLDGYRPVGRLEGVIRGRDDRTELGLDLVDRRTVLLRTERPEVL